MADEKEVVKEEEKSSEVATKKELTNEENTGENTADDAQMNEEVKEEAKEEVKEDSEPANRDEKKAKRLQKEFEKKEASYKGKIKELEDKTMRQMAEFENFRKRTEREKAGMFEMGEKAVIEKILPVVDNFERGIATVPEDKKEDPFVDGMVRIYKQLMVELEKMGVKPIEAVGKEFDPNFHNAVMQVEDENLESGTVAAELQKGYMFNDSVVRHSMVSVVQ